MKIRADTLACRVTGWRASACLGGGICPAARRALILGILVEVLANESGHDGGDDHAGQRRGNADHQDLREPPVEAVRREQGRSWPAVAAATGLAVMALPGRRWSRPAIGRSGRMPFW